MMTQEFIQKNYPSVFSDSPSPKLTNKYTFVPTHEIIKNFEKQGWVVSSVSQVGKGMYSKHQVRLRNQELPQVGDSLVEAVIKNSHNGFSTFSVGTGLFRLVCSNGLTVPQSVLENISIRHTKIDYSTIQMITEEFANRLPILERSLDKMNKTILDETNTLDFINKSALIRWESGKIPKNLSIEELLTPLRNEDDGNSVWQTFNVIQEKFVRGGLKYSSHGGRAMSMRQLKNFEAINKVNTNLWELAESFC